MASLRTTLIIFAFKQTLIIFALHLLVPEKVFLIGENPHHSWLLWMFQLVQEVLSSDQTVLPCSVGQELSSTHNIRFRFLTKVLMNRTLKDVLVNLKLPGECLNVFL